MRLDKFLKVSRLIKRRSIASAMCQAGRLQINGKTAKASSEVKLGDTLTIAYGNRTKTVCILDVPAKILPKHNSTDGASSLYSVLAETYNETGTSSEFDDFDSEAGEDVSEASVVPSNKTSVAGKTPRSSHSGQLDDLFSVLLGEDP